MDRGSAGTPLRSTGRISVEHVAEAVLKLRKLTLAQKTSLIDEIYIKQPHLLASCAVQAKFGADEQTIEFLLDILFACYLAMAESGYEWPLITDVEQERQLERMVGSVLFSEQLADPTAADAARAQYIAAHPEPVLLALVINECNAWLADMNRRNVEKESDKFVLMASVNLVNCIAHAHAERRRAS
ncbi:MAG TPA: hypothetical protein VI390_01640 [Methyloceanibacter sp.]